METNFGKECWADDASKWESTVKLAVMLLCVIFIMNSISTLDALYIALALVTGLLYIYFATRPDQAGARIRIYEKGLLMTECKNDEGKKEIEKFISWGDVKSLRVEKTGILKRTWLVVSCKNCSCSARLFNSKSFVNACRKDNRSVEMS
jgi:hypothetical protein